MKKDYREDIKSFVEDYSNISRYVNRMAKTPKAHEIVSMYSAIKTMWFDYRELFPNKGTYKTVRRLFIKHVAEYYAWAPIRWQYMPSDLFQEILFKARQRWLAMCCIKVIVRYLANWKDEEIGANQREHLDALWSVYIKHNLSEE